MIRNVVMGTVKDGVSPDQVERALEELRRLEIAGLDLRLVAGQDLGLRPGNASFSITVDFETEDDYRVYDLDEEHNRIRRALFPPMSESISRIQFRLPA